MLQGPGLTEAVHEAEGIALCRAGWDQRGSFEWAHLERGRGGEGDVKPSIVFMFCLFLVLDIAAALTSTVGT